MSAKVMLAWETDGHQHPTFNLEDCHLKFYHLPRIGEVIEFTPDGSDSLKTKLYLRVVDIVHQMEPEMPNRDGEQVVKIYVRVW